MGRVADGGVPGVDRELAGDDGGGAAVAVVHDLEEVAAVLGRKRCQAPIVENEELDAGEILEETGMPSVAAGECQSLEQPRHALVENGAAVAARLVPEGTGDPALADAGRAADQQIVMAVDPIAGGELLEERAIEAADGAQIDVLDDGGLAEGGELEPRHEALVVALGAVAVSCRAQLPKMADSTDRIERITQGAARVCVARIYNGKA